MRGWARLGGVCRCHCCGDDDCCGLGRRMRIEKSARSCGCGGVVFGTIVVRSAMGDRRRSLRGGSVGWGLELCLLLLLLRPLRRWCSMRFDLKKHHHRRCSGVLRVGSDPGGLLIVFPPYLCSESREKEYTYIGIPWLVPWLKRIALRFPLSPLSPRWLVVVVVVRIVLISTMRRRRRWISSLAAPIPVIHIRVLVSPPLLLSSLRALSTAAAWTESIVRAIEEFIRYFVEAF